MAARNRIPIRFARVDESGELSALCLRSKAHWGYDEAFLEACRDELTIAEHEVGDLLRVAEVDGVLAGVVQIASDRDSWSVEKLFVDPPFIGQGVGAVLLHWAMDAARGRGAKSLSIDADPDAAPFYRRYGAVDDGQVPSGSIPGRFLPRLVLSLKDAPKPRSDRFATHTQDYARFRPAYPQALLQRLRDLIVSTACAPTLPVVDVGSGTGIFTRQLSGVLPPDMAVIGVEPSDAMRGEALKNEDGVSVRYVSGTAERLPFADCAVRAVTAATAAHWFDRDAFYPQARRILASSGVLAIAEYVRDVEASPAAAALEAFLARNGGPKAYTRPDYPSELGSLAGFSDVAVFEESATFELTTGRFVGLALSSSHARAVESQLGVDQTRKRLVELAGRLMGTGETIPYGYRFRLYSVRKTG